MLMPRPRTGPVLPVADGAEHRHQDRGGRPGRGSPRISAGGVPNRGAGDDHGGTKDRPGAARVAGTRAEPDPARDERTQG